MHYEHIEEFDLPGALDWHVPAPRRRCRFEEAFASGAVYRRIIDKEAEYPYPIYSVLTTSRGKRVAS